MIKKIIAGGIIVCLSLIVGKSNIRENDKTKYKVDLPSLQDMMDKEVEEVEKEKKLEEIQQEAQKKRNKKKVKTTTRGTFRAVPKTNTSMKSYMDYRCITDKTSEQYRLQHSKNVYTDSEGFRRIGDSFIVAVGTYYADKVGEQLEITLSTGRTFKACVGDIKANCHTDEKNMQHKVDGSVIEFIVDSRNMDKLCKKMGNMSYAKKANLSGDIVSIKVLDK